MITLTTYIFILLLLYISSEKLKTIEVIIVTMAIFWLIIFD